MAALLLIAFLVVPLVELMVIVEVQQTIGLGWTILALIGISVAGATLVKREGLKAWRRLRNALDEARLPAAEVVDGALLLFAGALLLTPGFVTDAVGLLLLLPPTRALVNRVLRGRARRSIGLPGSASRRSAGRRTRAGRATTLDGSVDVEVVDVKRNQPPGEQASRTDPHRELG